MMGKRPIAARNPVDLPMSGNKAAIDQVVMFRQDGFAALRPQ